jgi:hypothetical protein
MPQKIPWPDNYLVGFSGRSPEGDVLLNYAKYLKDTSIARGQQSASADLLVEHRAEVTATAAWWSKHPDLLSVLANPCEAEKQAFWRNAFTPCGTYFKQRLPVDGSLIVRSAYGGFGDGFARRNYAYVCLLHAQEAISSIQRALSQESPFLFDVKWEGRFGKHTDLFLFGPYLWMASPEERAAEPEHFRLLFLEAVDKDRIRIERLKNKFSGLAGSKLERSREPIPESVRIFVWRRDEGKCVRCGSNERLEFDHIIPLAEGGSNTERNLQLLCEACNRVKGTNI